MQTQSGIVIRKNRFAVILLALVAIGGMCPAHGAAGIELLSETGTALSMKFTDAVDAQLTMNFGKTGAGSVWMSQTQQSGIPGIVFGNDQPQFAGAAALRDLNITPQQAVQTFDSTIRNRPLDDVTIYRLHQDEMLIALWQDGVITELWFVGTFFQGYETGPDAEDGCAQSKSKCCRKKAIDPPPDEGPLEHPNPSISNCLAVINSCGSYDIDAVCDCLDDACDWCPEPPAQGHYTCQSVDGLQELADEACAMYTSQCNPGPPPSPPVPPIGPILEALGEALDRIQAIIDSH